MQILECFESLDSTADIGVELFDLALIAVRLWC
jgi:hypothetical protein